MSCLGSIIFEVLCSDKVIIYLIAGLGRFVLRCLLRGLMRIDVEIDNIDGRIVGLIGFFSWIMIIIGLSFCWSMIR